MRYIALIAFWFAALFVTPIEAQGTRVVADCAAAAMNWTANDLGRPLLVDTAGRLCNATDNGYPSGSTPLTATGTGTTGAVTATLAGAANVTTYICGFSVSQTNATAAQAGSVTLTGVITATMNFGAPSLAAGAAVSHPEKIVQSFFPCIPSSAVNTSIVVNSPALGAGATLNTAAAWGYRK
jgi:hypothetical protein